jgi:hypothetical protein
MILSPIELGLTVFDYSAPRAVHLLSLGGYISRRARKIRNMLRLEPILISIERAFFAHKEDQP